MTEDEFQTRVMDVAARLGWLRVHVPTVAVSRGSRTYHATTYRGDKGLPDLILARGGRVLLAELKSDTGKPTAEQSAWLEAAGDNGHLWRPQGWAQVLEELR